MARGSVVDESRLITAKIPLAPHQGSTHTTNTSEKAHQLPTRCQKCIEHRNNGEQGEEPAFHEAPEFLSGETPSCRLYLAAQLGGVMRDGQGLLSVRLRVLTSLVLSLVLGFV